MSTIKSSTEHLTLNADGSGKDIKFQANGVEKASISSAGAFTSTSIDATKLSGTVPNFTSTGIDDNATSTAITIDANENVGIGTTSPSALLHLNSTTANPTGIGIQNSQRYYAIESEGYGLRVKDVTAGSLERMRIDSSGNVLINQTSKVGAEKLGVSFDRTSEWGMAINNTSSTAPANATMIDFRYIGSHTGHIGSNGTSTSYNTSSDYRLKENVVPMSGSIDRLKQLKPSRFNFIADADKTVDGFLAHEASEVVPECATGTKDAMMDEEYEVTPAVMDGETVVTEAVMGTRSVPDYQGIDQSKLVPLLVASLQEAVAKIEALEV